jgi:hypothetical protein
MPRKSTSITRVDGKAGMVSESYVSSPSSQFTMCSMHAQKCSPLGVKSGCGPPPSRLVVGEMAGLPHRLFLESWFAEDGSGGPNNALSCHTRILQHNFIAKIKKTDC